MDAKFAAVSKRLSQSLRHEFDVVLLQGDVYLLRFEAKAQAFIQERKTKARNIR